MEKKVRILSLDGGGIRGIIPGEILAVLEEKIQKKTRNPQARLSSYFDLVAGTSTGGILALGLLCPQEEDLSQAKFSVRDILSLYYDFGPEIFSVPFFYKLSSFFGLTNAKFPEKKLQETLEKFFGKLLLSQCLKPSLITSYDIVRRRNHFFTSLDAKSSKAYDYYLRDITRSTSAAPTYFRPSLIKALDGEQYAFIDGGLFANNPALCAYSEVRHEFEGKPTAKDILIVSIGTGKVKKAYKYSRAKNWGKVSWIVPVIDILMSSGEESTSFHLSQIFDAAGVPKQFVRIEPKLLHASSAMDDVSKENLAALKEAGQSAAREYDEELDRIVDMIV